jgi:CRISPR-associated endonuclease/helicase Cas3/CRISPR-associated endonuclease Cas3-HD
MLYSCLVDADSLDTERFVSPGLSKYRGGYDTLDALSERFNVYIHKFKQLECSDLNRYRNEIYQQCIDKSELPQGMFTLTVPTGGGKTLSSTAFAVAHARKHELKRIFFIAPYTSIIEQNAKVIRDIFGNGNVLEHHSNYTVGDDDPKKEQLNLYIENWDVPIIFTTPVQLFDSLFSNKRSQCRKIHNLSKSVIVIDEAQMIPTEYLEPCMAVLEELVRNYNTTVVFCTATQPPFNNFLEGDTTTVEIITNPTKYYDAFRNIRNLRVEYIGEQSDAQISERIGDHEQALIIVNTRDHARYLYSQINKEGCEGYYHLSARMCPAHRSKIITEIKQRLKEGLKCIVVSTQLIEAGVDIDFPVVYRSMAGIDSINQAGGRCNREGKRCEGMIYIFTSTEIYAKVLGKLNRISGFGEQIIKRQPDIFALQAISDYYNTLYFFEGSNLDKHRILHKTDNPEYPELANKMEYPFKEIGDTFSLIEENGMVDLIIPYDNKAHALISKIKSAEFPLRELRGIQKYIISIYPKEFKELERNHMIEVIGINQYVLKSYTMYYDQQMGLLTYPKHELLDI